MAAAVALAALAGVLAMFAALACLWGLPIHVSATGIRAIEQRKALADVFKVALGLAAGLGAVVALALNYRRHRIEESQSHRDDDRLFTEHFRSATEQLGHVEPAVRLAGVHALSRLADDWPEQRQTCIDVLCAYVRLPIAADAEMTHEAGGAPARNSQTITPRAEREVRQTIVRLIADHLRDEATWRGLDFDFTGAVFDGAFSFAGATFSGSQVSFQEATFVGPDFDFDRVVFAQPPVNFRRATFLGDVRFRDATFSSLMDFAEATFAAGTVNFADATFCGDISFDWSTFSGGIVGFGATFLRGHVSFFSATFSGTDVRFLGAEFVGADVSFRCARFAGGQVSFGQTKVGDLTLEGARFVAGTVDFSNAADWTVPPTFDGWDALPAGVSLP